jgi:hypothetical protein
MSSKTYCIRTSNEAVIDAVAAFAKQHGIAESTAIGRMLAEGIAIAAGKPIVRFAVLDPNANENYSLALGQLRELSRVLKRTVAVLARPQPMDAAENKARIADQKVAREALAEVLPAVHRLKKAGKMEFMLLDMTPAMAEASYDHAVKNKRPMMSMIFGALVGKPGLQSIMETGCLPTAPLAVVGDGNTKPDAPVAKEAKP